MKKLTKFIKATKAFFAESLCYNFAPYTICNKKTGKQHYAWSYKAALEWLACYKPKHFGETVIVDRRGEFVASVQY